ncbi:BRO-N domain-containing protein [Psychrobacter glaciei]|uniref:BRO-N domain-containing protein n=1 Tax=Psychrobacter glaciei TaxID=619771 RepID=UPI003F47BCDE
MNTLTFNGTTLTTINQDDQVWLTSSDLAAALGYKTADSVTRMFNRNKDEFSPNMTQVIETVKLTASSKTKGLMAKIRIFSLRGCHLLAMFARTDIAKAFRVWVLDILEREVKTTSHQRTPLRKACDRLAVGNMLISDAYKIVTNHYNVDHIDQIPESKLPEAVAFVYDVILARQASNTNHSKYIDDMHGIGKKKVEETRHAISVIQKALASLDCGIEVIKQNNEKQASVFESLKSQTARVVK